MKLEEITEMTSKLLQKVRERFLKRKGHERL